MQRRWVAAAGVAVVLLGGTAEASPGAGMAGGGAGAGRAHPGRGQEPEREQGDPVPAGGPVLPDKEAPVDPAVGEEEGAGRGLDVLPLGAGLVLVGLGLGFAGWRIRRG
jgi:hypothetical protein